MKAFIAFLCFAASVSTVHTQCASNIPCFAPSIDVAKLIPHNMTINSTCGNPVEDFCVGTDCSLKCDAADEQTLHPPSYLVDKFELNTFWKSKNFDEPVFIQCDFGYNLVLHQITITFQFELPNSLYIQRSQNFQQDFKTLAYFAIRCNDTFGLSEAAEYDELKVQCYRIDPGAIQRQISYAPRRDEYVATEVLKGGAVRDYFLATSIRIFLHEFFMPSDYDRSAADPRKFYFAIKDIDMQASCSCNGMSNQCSPSDYGTCICQKNTEGLHCHRCKSLYNNRPWQFGVACANCECNSHSLSCTYVPLRGYGVCESCMHNTMGDKCEKCSQSFYRDSQKLISDVDVCISCNCYIPGVLFGSSVCDGVTGQCFCKSSVEVGGLCDTCKDGYYGLSANIMNGCNPCGCSVYGTIGGTVICDKVTGICPCKAGFTSRTCSECKSRFYGYPSFNPVECRACDCDPSGSVNMTCDKSGQCLCRAFYFGSKCEQIQPGYYSASVGQLLFTANEALVSSPSSYTYMSRNLTDSSGNTFYILGYSVGLSPDRGAAATMMTFDVQIPKVLMYEFFLQYKTLFEFTGVTLQVQIRSTFFPYSCDNGASTITTTDPMTLSSALKVDQQAQSFGSLCLMTGNYKVVLWFPSNSAGVSSHNARIFVLSLLLMPQYQSQLRYQQLSTSMQLLVQQYYLMAASRVLWVSQEAVGATYLAYSYGSIYNNALACNCNPLGTINPVVCNIYGGQCNCKENIYGRTCHACLPQYYNFSSGLGCVPCNCDSQGSLSQECDYNTGQCSCKPNVIGRTCNQCALRHYGVAYENGCQPCMCSSLYATSSQCDESGQCPCKTGVGSLRCGECLPGYYDLSITGCETCLCNPVGTSGNKCNPTTGTCNCKSLVMGTKCDRCTVGYYGFSSDFPETCLKCYCSGKTEVCDAANDFYLTTVSTVFATTLNNVGLEEWEPVDESGQEAGKLEWDWAPLYSMERGFAKLTDISDNPHLFYAAPEIFLGNKRSLYMYYLEFDLTQEDTSNPMDASNIGDVIIHGKGQSFKLVTTLSSPPPKFQSFQTYKVKFYENVWHKDLTTGSKPTLEEFLWTISDLDYVFIRARWTKRSGSFVGISNIVMTYSSYNMPNSSGMQLARNVEYCNCPVAYTGQFCQRCNSGYTRFPVGGGIMDSCVPCQCNQHSKRCDASNGICSYCEDHTEGLHCETCISGYYGDASNGLQDDCKECACPGGLNAPNQFAHRCMLDRDNEPTCIECESGYTGRRCEVCHDGYYGNPMDPQGVCRRCVCNSNVDDAAAGNCNTTTGQCLRCLYNTIGDSCQYCRPGYYGDAITRNCKECACDLIGSLGKECQNMTGHCQCKQNVIGRICNTCAPNTFNFLSNEGCELCQCHQKGSEDQQCDVMTGRCRCKTRVIGDKCERCAPGYYDLSKGCLPCNCNEEFTDKNTTCDALYGQCMCVVSPLGGKYSGRTCNECAVNAIGTPPNCELCHSPCYDNWQGYIEGEEFDIRVLDENVTDLLAKFGSMSYDDVMSHLMWLNDNLTLAMKVFSGGRYNTSEKVKQFKHIETQIIEFESVLNQTDEQLDSSKVYFQTTVNDFTGVVSLYATIPHPYPVQSIRVRMKRHVSPVYVDSALVSQMANSFITTTYGNNVSGQAVYSTIENQYKQVLSANESIADASSKLAEAISGLSQAAVERARAYGYMDGEYTAAFDTNAYELRKIHDIVASVMILENRTVSIHTAALETLEKSKDMVSEAEGRAVRAHGDAEAASQQVSQMKVDAVTLKANVAGQLSVATNLKRTVDDVLYDTQQETESLADGVTDIATARNKTLEARSIAYEILNMSLPVSLMEIQILSNQIINTVVNEGVINETYNDAHEGLVMAQEVEKRSKQAVDVSQSTLNDIRDLENSINQSFQIRTVTQKAQADNVGKSYEVQNITARIESEFSVISGQGAQTLNLLTSAISAANMNSMCFVDAKAIIDNATRISAQARLKANDALALHSSNEQGIPSYATQINRLYAQTSATHAQASQTKDMAQKLLDDVTEAEHLKNELSSRKSELDVLKAETDAMEAELNNLMLKYENARTRFSGCNTP